MRDKIHAAGSPVSSNRSVAVLRALWNWARDREMVTANPCDGVKKLTDEAARDRVFTDEELRSIVRVMKDTPYRDRFDLILRCATRSHETSAARLSDVDVDRHIWTIPASNAKAGRKHEVQLSSGAWAIVQRLMKAKSPWLFPGDGRECPVCEQEGHALPMSHRDMEGPSILAGLMTNTGTVEAPVWVGDPIRAHDIRRTIADRMVNVLGVPVDVVDLGVLGHAASKLVRTYMPAGVSSAKVREALEAWSRHLDSILAVRTPRVTARSPRKARTA
jgi:integrase